MNRQAPKSDYTNKVQNDFCTVLYSFIYYTII